MEKKPVLCLNCGEPIKKGRSDKKFCDSACKDEYYNSRKSDEHQDIKKVDLTIKKNRRILKKLLGNQSEIIVKKDSLLEQGFKFDYHTHHVISKLKGNEFIFCYDYGYHKTPDGQFKIVKGFMKR
ncbi:MAG: hypothetical protein JST87_18555 [Bacteroidetes bacterium]|nr:hypothetical protein [Bacteroidota bacterium]